MENSAVYLFDDEERKILEELPIPLAVYQFADNKVVAILVSDGMCRFEGMTRDEVLYMFNHDMYRNVHPEDALEIPKAAYRFATKGGLYNVTYRERLGGCQNYRILHATGEHVRKKDGTRLSYIRYEDITDALEADDVNAMEVRRQISSFFDNNMEAMAVVAQQNDQLLYYNRAICRMFPPSCNYDTGMTFDRFFFGKGIQYIHQIYALADFGPKTIVNPVTGKKAEVNVLTTSWEEEPAYLICFYEYESEDAERRERDEKRNKRIAFNRVMFSGDANSLDYTDPDYKAFWIWNLTDNGKIVREEGHESLIKILDGRMDYDNCRNNILKIVADDESLQFLQKATIDGIISDYYEHEYKQNVTLTINSSKGLVSLRSSWLIMESPDTGELYLKVSEENVTSEQLLRTMIKSMIGERFDMMAYIDRQAGEYRIFDENTGSSEFIGDECRPEETCARINMILGRTETGEDNLIEYLRDKCGCETEVSEVVELKKTKQYKSIQINMLNKEAGQFFITSSDITEPLLRERKLQDELRKALTEAEKVGKDRDDFIARTSHDLRTPLSAVISFSDFGREECDLPEFSTYFRKIHSSGEFMLDMLNDIIDIEKLQAGKIEKNFSDVYCQDFVQEVVDVISPHAEEKKIRLELDSDMMLQAENGIRIDKQIVKQILTNILSNAVKYTPEGGNVCWVFRRIAIKGGSAAIENIIRDNGVGMSKDFQKHMFESYSREYNVLSSRESSTGLGLAIVKKLIDAIGGEIAAESTLGQGTVFRVVIPCEIVNMKRDDPGEITGNSRENEKYDFSGKTIMVCEDNEINQQIIRKMLEKTGAVIRNEYNGKACVERIKISCCDLILMDIMMPVMNGLDAAREIRSMGNKVPIIALSANANEAEVRQSYEAGMDAHLTKPIDIQKFYKTLAVFLNK